MDEYESLSHTKWECKYHVVFIPKCRRKTLYVGLRKGLGEVFRRLAEQKESRIEEGHLMNDHVHMLIAIPPRYAVSQVVGFISRPGVLTRYRDLCPAPCGRPVWGSTPCARCPSVAVGWDGHGLVVVCKTERIRTAIDPMPRSYRGAWPGDPKFPPVGPAPTGLPPNRHPIQRVAARAAVESHLGKDPCGPERGRARGGRAWQLPGAHGGRREWAAGREEPCPEHRAWLRGVQDSCWAGEPEGSWLGHRDHRQAIQ